MKANGHVELRLFGEGSKERQATVTLDLYQRILATFLQGEYLCTMERGNPYDRKYITKDIDRAARRVLGHASEATMLKYHVT